MASLVVSWVIQGYSIHIDTYNNNSMIKKSNPKKAERKILGTISSWYFVNLKTS